MVRKQEQSLPTETLSQETDKLTKNKQRSRFGSKGEEASRREFSGAKKILYRLDMYGTKIILVMN